MKKLVVIMCISLVLSWGLSSVAFASHGGGGHGGGSHGGSHGGFHGGGFHGGSHGGFHGGGSHDGSHFHGGHHHGGAQVFFGGSFWYPGYPYYYPYPYPYYYPYPAEPYNEPPVFYSEPRQDEYWYYCPEAQAYYPYVTSCPQGWTRVTPTPPSENQVG